MADPRLRLRQIAAPNFSSANNLLIASGKSFQDAFDPFKDALQRYGEGQKERGDAQAAALIADVQNEEDFNKLLQSGQLQRLNTSPAGTRMIEEARSGALGLMGDRQRMAIADDVNARAAAAEGRTAQTFQSEQERQAWLRANAPEFIEAEQGAFAQGAAPASLIVTESGGRWNARNNVPGAGGTGHFGRVQFGHARFEEAKAAGAVPPNMTIEEFGSDTEAGRRAQQTAENWHFGDIQNRIQDTSLDQYIGKTIGGVTITRDGMVAMAHLGGFGGMKKFLESGGQYNPADANGTSLSDYAKTHSGNTTGSGSGGGQPTPGTPSTGTISTTRGGEDFAMKMAESGLFTPNEVMAQITGLREAYGDGEAEARAAEAEALQQLAEDTNNILAAYVSAGVLDPENETPQDAARAAANAAAAAQNLTEAERLSLVDDALQMIEQGGLGDNFAQVQPDLQFEADVETAVGAEQARLAQDPSSSVQADIERYSEDPVKALLGDLGDAQENDPRFNWFGDERNLELNEVGARNRMNEVAEELDTTPEIAALLMREVYNPDPTGRNTLENRFPIEEMKDLLPNFDLDAISDSISDQAQLGRMEGEMNRLATERQRVATQLARARNPREEARYREELARLDAQLLVIQGQGANRPPQ